MTTYEAIKRLPEVRVQRMVAAGQLQKNWRRDIAIYEYWQQVTARGKPRMEAYIDASEHFFTGDDNVRRIVGYMQREWRK